ncbi:hypothetical protein [Treponema sp.]|uniref:hypothetical protein n=1 Tax=Treponema sp. TaxID=166 RepID=UPI003F02DFB2
MKLEKLLRLDELKSFFDEYHITIKKNNSGINLITKNNFTVSIHKQLHVLPENEQIIYLDCHLRAFGLPEFRRDWHENENLSDYIVKVVIPYIADLGGPFTISEDEVANLLTKRLLEYEIKIEESKKSDLKFIIFDSLGNEVESIMNNRPLIIFSLNNTRYAINYHKAFIDLVIFKNQNDNEVLMTYPWYSFCSVFLSGNDYVDAAVKGIINFINNR